ncbi:MAG: hypothetical protein ABEK59_01300 [Halobacteria archaeon]
MKPWKFWQFATVNLIVQMTGIAISIANTSVIGGVVFALSSGMWSMLLYQDLTKKEGDP